MVNNICFELGNQMFVGPVVQNDLKQDGVIFMAGGKVWFYNLNKIHIIF